MAAQVLDVEIEEVAGAGHHIVTFGRSGNELRFPLLLYIEIEVAVLAGFGDDFPERGEEADIVEGLRGIGRDVHALKCANGKAADGPVRLVGDGAEMAVHIAHDVVHESAFHRSVDLVE